MGHHYVHCLHPVTSAVGRPAPAAADSTLQINGTVATTDSSRLPFVEVPMATDTVVGVIAFSATACPLEPLARLDVTFATNLVIDIVHQSSTAAIHFVFSRQEWIDDTIAANVGVRVEGFLSAA